jgi:RNA-dependent RNA polymerase
MRSNEEYDFLSQLTTLFFALSYVLGTSANCWLTLMDRLLTPGVSQSEKDLIKINMLELVDIYYWSLDAPKNGNKVVSNHGLVCFIDRP